MSNTDNQQELRSLQSDQRTAQNDVNRISGNISTLRRRLSDLETTRSNLSSVMNIGSTSVNGSINSLTDHLINGLNPTGRSNRIAATLRAGREGTLGNDANLTSADGQLAREIADVQRQIEALQREQRNAQSRLDQATTSIRNLGN